MAMLSAAQVADNWAARLAASTERIRQGVQSVTVAPQQAAAAAAPLWQQRVSSPEAMAKYQASLARSTLADWQTAMTAKGISRIATGAAAAKPKFTAFMQSFLPFVQNAAQQVRSMPKGGIENSIARMAAMARAVHQYKRS